MDKEISDVLYTIFGDTRGNMAMLFAPAELNPYDWRCIVSESLWEERYFRWVLSAEPQKLMTYKKFREMLKDYYL